MRLLIVDDNENMRRLIKTLVGDLAQQIYECSDGVYALSSFTEHQPDYVLMDIEMEKVDGLTAIAQIKSAYPAARVVVVSNYDNAPLREAAQNAGACQYLPKDKLLLLRAILSREASL
ncbi:MAG TPA: response regulator transcription factor [Blastocatellia bacterium]|nr:response regulator transcription factor [Blastocatellia bacterium]